MTAVNLAASIGVIVLILASIKIWQYTRRKRTFDPNSIQPSTSGVSDDFQAVWTDADAFVKQADSWTPYLIGDKSAKIKPNPYFFLAVVTSTILLAFSYSGGMALASNQIFYGLLFTAVLVIVQIAQAIISLSGDNGTAEIWEAKKSDRSTSSWAMLSVLLVINVCAALVGSITVGSQSNTKQELATEGLTSRMQARKDARAQLTVINARLIADGQGMSAAAMISKANGYRDEAIRESWRSRKGQSVDEAKVKAGKYGKKCGSNCSNLAGEAVKWQALAKDAEKKEKLEAQLAGLNEKLDNTSGVSKEGSAIGARISEMSLGMIGKESAAKNIWVFFQVLIVWLDWVLWLRVGDGIGRARRVEYDKRAELGNNYLENAGYDPRYQRMEKPEITTKPTKAGDKLEVKVEQDVASVISSSKELASIHNLFVETVETREMKAVPFGIFYKLYATKQKASDAEKWMTQAAFTQALKRYCELKKITCTGGKIVGHTIKGDAMSTQQESALVVAPEEKVAA